MKRMISFFTAMLISFCVFSVVIKADGSVHLDDGANLLTESQQSSIEQQLISASKELGFDIVIVTTMSVGDKTVMDYADDYYDYNGYSPDGILMLINMGERDIYFSTAGKCIGIFTDYGIEYLVDDVGPYLTDSEYYDAFERFIDRCRFFTEEYNNERAFDTDNRIPSEPMGIMPRIIISLIIGFIVALIVTSSMKSKLKSVRYQASALPYTKQNSLNISQSRDLFLYSNVTRTAIPRDSGTRSGGSSTHTSSSGTTHGGGGGKF